MKSITLTGSLVVLLASLTGACFEDVPVGTDTTDGGTADGGKACTTSTDCASGEECGFASAEACAAKGLCYAVPGATCAAYSAGCACDGTEINVACTGLPTGIETKPLAHTGACTGDAIAPSDGGGAACASSSDCGANEICGFPTADGCSATGQCFVLGTGAACQAFSPGCACDGTEVNLACNGLPTGYETRPLLHTGACGADAGAPSDGGGAPCTTSADCPSSGICGFAEADACNATGQCFPSPGVTCGAFSPGCACDGSEINVACNGLPTGYETLPLLHTGVCTPPATDAATGG